MMTYSSPNYYPTNNTTNAVTYTFTSSTGTSIYYESTKGPGSNVILYPGKGTEGYEDGSIILNDADGNELLGIHSNKTISVLGTRFSLELVKEALDSFKDDKCKCPMRQLITNGCNCGGN